MSRGLKLTLGIVISMVAVWLSMRDVSLSEVLIALRKANWLGFVGVMAATVFAFWLRAVRWRSLLSTPRPVSYDSLFGATMIGFMANNILPFRLGEFVRAWALGRSEKLSKTTVFATVVVERVVDMITLLGILGLTLLVHPIGEGTEAGRMTRAGASVLVLGTMVMTAIVILLERKPALAHALVGAATRRLPPRVGDRMATALNQFIEGLGVFSDVPRLLWVLLMSFLMFGVFALGLTASMWALRIDVPWYGGLVMLVITAIGIMVPAAPGYIGTMNLACIAGLALFSVGKEQAVPFSWFYWAGQWIPVTVVGFYYLHRAGLSLRSLGEAQQDAA